jgi:hypothetical protein
MSNNEIAFSIFYGVIAVVGICVVLRYLYYEIYKNKGGNK